MAMFVVRPLDEGHSGGPSYMDSAYTSFPWRSGRRPLRFGA